MSPSPAPTRKQPWWRRPGVWLGLLAFLGVGFYGAQAIKQTSPGPISAVHAQVIDIEGMNSCAECHGGWFSDMSSSCQTCHEPIAAQLDSGEGLHGRLAPVLGKQCGTCHGEHHGEAFQLVNRRSFAMAGVADASAFDHGLIGFAMDGHHLELACQECHPNAGTTLLREGQHRFLGLEQNCATCHDDPHGGRMQLDCTACHSQREWSQLQAPDHGRHLHLIGGHSGLACIACHGTGSDRDLQVVGAQPGRASRRACVECHESPHDSEVVAATAASVGTSPGLACRSCHAPEHGHFRDQGLASTMRPAWHRASGFPLDGAHLETDCSGCHDPDQPTFAARYPGRAPRDCNACHGDVHLGQFANSPLAPEGCVDCHNTAHFAPSGIDVARHLETGFALEGSHATTECKACHLNAVGTEVQMFHGTVNECQLCHQDPHGGLFDTFPEVTAAAGGTCAHCHGVETFAHGDPTRFDHHRFTGVPVDGAHGFAGCGACHNELNLPDELGRTFARAEEVHAGAGFVGCAGCHDDPHDGRFDTPELPQAVADRVGCARCHTTSSFRAVGGDFDHETWTGFPVRGAHAALECGACHTTRPDTEVQGMTLGQVAGKNCADCHSDPHAGQFLESKQADCSRCHTDGQSFKELVFLHDVQSRFELGDAHRKLDCAACHRPFEHGGRMVVRYRPLPRDCAACHGDARTPFRRKGR